MSFIYSYCYWYALLQRRKYSAEQKGVALVRVCRNHNKDTLDIVKLLIHEGASVGSIRAGTTALCEAVKSGTEETE